MRMLKAMTVCLALVWGPFVSGEGLQNVSKPCLNQTNCTQNCSSGVFNKNCEGFWNGQTIFLVSFAGVIWIAAGVVGAFRHFYKTEEQTPLAEFRGHQIL